VSRVFSLRVRADASGYYGRCRGLVMPHQFLTVEEAEDVRRAMPNGNEFEVVDADTEECVDG
jgi:hypothetical protein